jgi:hypothetical protein
MPSIGAVVEMGILSTFKRLLMESRGRQVIDLHAKMKSSCNSTVLLFAISSKIGEYPGQPDNITEV